MDILRELKKKIADIDAQTLAMEGRSPTFTVSEIMDLIDSMESAQEINRSEIRNSSEDVPDINVGDTISRHAATQTALEFIVEYLGGAFDEDLQKKMAERMDALPSAKPDHIVDGGKKVSYSCGHENDPISRQAAIDALDKIFDSIPMEQTTEILTFRRALRELPSAQPEIIRCKDCKHRPKATRADEKVFYGFSVVFPDEKCPCYCEDGWYGWYPKDDFYCGYAACK